MKNKLRIGFLLGASLLSQSSLASPAHLTAVKATLMSVEKAIKSAVTRAEELFEQNHGRPVHAAATGTAYDYNLLNPASGATPNPYLRDLRILASTGGYAVALTFNAGGDTAFVYNSSSPNTSVPVAQSLYGTHIQLIPVYNSYVASIPASGSNPAVQGHPGDSVINSWECITDADKHAIEFIGKDVAATVNNISFLSTNGNSGTNEYLSACVYVDNAVYLGAPDYVAP